ncbi:hypothetical protein EVG20_g10798 [Dentipellis fragilis]|uniref:Uncharacterized protein n=1 Tax=Dentipellis fragilis TaxID=205917 RepID=A0A4Y9XR62_9AGAM|nr:hypothetical protein EVG20_g10798 [Dentipellis fragilis]
MAGVSPFTGHSLSHIPAFYVYHYRDLYFIWDHRDPFQPESSSIYRDLSVLTKFSSSSIASECFRLWLQGRCMALEQKLDAHRKAVAQDGGEGYLDVPINGFWISKEPERKCSWSPVHIFEIDLNWLTFSIDNIPIFRLDNMPPGPILSNTGRDTYGHIAPKLTVPRKHWYAWKTDPPQVDDTLLWEYNRLCGDGPLLPIHELLGVQPPLSPPERVRVRLLEVLINHSLLHHENTRVLRELAKVPSRDQLPLYTAAVLMTMLVSVMDPFPRCWPLPSHPEYHYDLADLLQLGFLRSNVCLILWTHLDDDANLHAAAAHLVCEVKRRRPSLGIVYGILFSGSHIVIMRIDLTAGGKIAHTAALPFLPDNFTTSPSTPGITALGRLLSLEDPQVLSKLRPMFPTSDSERSKLEDEGFHYATGGMLDRLSTDTLARIQSHLPDTKSRVIFASLCPRTAQLPTKLFNEVIMQVKGRDVRLVSMLPHDAVDSDISFEGCRLDPAVFGAAFHGILDDGRHVAVLVDRTANIAQVPLVFTLKGVRFV